MVNSMEISKQNVVCDNSEHSQRFLELRKLGQGTYGKVHLALNRATNEEVAVKTIKKVRVNNERSMKRIRREIAIMSSIRHPHIIHIQEVFETEELIIIVMQYARGGELYEYLVRHETLPDEEARRIFRQIVSAVYYCHKNKICHRDLKLENILLDSEGNAQIGDFGLSNTFDDKETMNTSCGSPLYASPEIVNGMSYKGPEVDCWSLGVLLYTLVYGTMPFLSWSLRHLVRRISEADYTEPENKSTASSLIQRLLTPDVSKRATISDVCEDPWMSEGYSDSFLEEVERISMAAGLPKKANFYSTQNNNLQGSRQKQLSTTPTSQQNGTISELSSGVQKNPDILPAKDETRLPRQSTTYDQEVRRGVHATQKFVDAGETLNSDQKIQKGNENVINMSLESVEACPNSDDTKTKRAKAKTRMWNLKRKDNELKNVHSAAVVIPIFDVTSTTPSTDRAQTNVTVKEKQKALDIKSEFGKDNSVEGQVYAGSANNITLRENSPHVVSNGKLCDHPDQPSEGGKPRDVRNLPEHQKCIFPTDGKEKKKKKLNRTASVKSNQNRKKREPVLVVESKEFDVPQKRPMFFKTKNHVLNLARLLSLNYENLKQGSLQMSVCKKRPPGKLTIPPTFSPSRPITKMPVEKKELLIFPTVSVSENKEKIQKKIEKIKKAALDTNLVIRSDTKSRMRIESFIRSQVRQIQNLVAEEQRSIRASLENLDEQSFRTMYYRTFGSENTDSGIVSTEDDDYFCFLCSKPTSSEGTSAFLSSATLDSIKKDCLYTSNHLHIPGHKRLYNWRQCPGNSTELGTLSRCKSEIHFPVEYLNYISSDKSGLNKRSFYQQKIKNNNIDLSQYFFTKPSLAKIFNPNNFVLRSASDSVGLNINSTIEVVKLNADSSSDVLPSRGDFLKHVSNPNSCNTADVSERYNFPSYPNADGAKVLTSQSSQISKDDGICDSNNSFQSWNETRQLIASLGSSSRTTCDSMNAKEQFFLSLSKQLFSEKNLHPGPTFHSIRTPMIQMKINSISSLNIFTKGSEERQYASQTVRRCCSTPCLRDGEFRDARLECGGLEMRNFVWNDSRRNTQNNAVQCAQSSSSQCWNGYSSDRKSFLEALNNTKRAKQGVSLQDTGLELTNTSNLCDKSSSYFENILMQLSNLPDCPKDRKNLNRAKSLGSDADTEKYDKIHRLKARRRLSEGFGLSQPDFYATYENAEYEKVDRKTKKKPRNTPRSKSPKPKQKKSFLHLLALKRIQEAEKELKELDKNPKTEIEEENSGSLLEALKTHGYKSVISQRFQHNDDYQDSYFTRRVKTAEQLRAEVARLNYMYYESQPVYATDSCTDPGHMYTDLDYATSLFNESPMPPFFNLPFSVSHTPKQSVHDWLNTIQADEYSNLVQSEASYKPEEMAPLASKSHSRAQWVRDSSLEDSSPSGRDQCLHDVAKHEPRNDRYDARHREDPDVQSNTDDEKEESVRDRIWRKSFYSRFNDRALSRRLKSPMVETEFSSDSRLGLNGILNPSSEGIERFDGYRSLRSSKKKKSLSHIRQAL